MKAIILAAGTGSRMKGLTTSKPKCLLELHNNSIIEHQISLLNKFGIFNIDVITGFESNKIKKTLKDKVNYYYYPDFEKTNNLYTLNYHSNLLNDDLLILFSDLLIHPDILGSLISNKSDFSFMVDISKCDESTMRVNIFNNLITDIGSHVSVDVGDGNFIGISKFSSKASKLLKNRMNHIVSKGIYNDDYYTKAIADMALEGQEINYVDVKNRPWLEVDTEEEYNIAKKESFYVID